MARVRALLAALLAVLLAGAPAAEASFQPPPAAPKNRVWGKNPQTPQLSREIALQVCECLQAFRLLEVRTASGSVFFLQRDPSGYADSVNLYAGFANDPVNLKDPTGRIAIPLVVSLIIVVLAEAAETSLDVASALSSFEICISQYNAYECVAGLMSTLDALTGPNPLGDVLQGYSAARGNKDAQLDRLERKFARATRRHSADYEHRDSSGRIVSRGSVESGSDVKPGRRLTRDEQLQVHTETKILQRLEGRVKRGDIITIRGARPPCNPGNRGCMTSMRDFAKRNGVTIRYTALGQTWIFP